MNPTFIRTGSLLFVMFCLCGLTSCSRKSEQQARTGPTDQVRTEGQETLQQTFTGKPPRLRIYFEKEPVPPAFLEAWPGHSGFEILQTRLIVGEDGKWPQDGDLYILSPRFFSSLNAQIPLAEWPDRTLLEGVNPAFTDHGFDPLNKYTRPWRWTPYVFYLRQAVEGKPVVFEFHDWSTDDQSLWPADGELLLGMKRHVEGKSANPLRQENEAKELESLKEHLKEHSATEDECWKALLEGRIQRTFLPASLRLKQPEEAALKNVDWQISQKGTLTHFDHFAVAAASPHKEQAQGLVQFLLQPEQQTALVRESGYFPVVTAVGHEIDLAPVKLPGSPLFAWFNLTEFLVDKVPVVPVPAVTASPVQAGPISPVTPSGK